MQPRRSLLPGWVLARHPSVGRVIVISALLALLSTAGGAALRAPDCPHPSFNVKTPVKPSPVANAADPAAWTNMNPIPSPSGRTFPAMVYDSAADRVVLYGGVFLGALGDTWTYDLEANAWDNVTPAISPPALSGPGLAYDAAWDRTVLFGGWDGGYANDTWTHDLGTNTWQDMHPLGAPSPRSDPSLVYDAGADRIVLFGGYTTLGTVNDTWIYDLGANTWTQAHPRQSPSSRIYTSLAYDSWADRVILFGGYNDTALRLLNDTWTYDVATETWTNRSASRAPSPRSYLAMDYDPRVDRTILFGGFTGNVHTNETWSYDLGANAWTNVTPAGSPPRAVSRALVYDARANRTILFEGDTNGSFASGTWTFVHPPVPPASVGPFLNLRAANAGVTVTWQAPVTDGGSPITGYTIYRSIRAGFETRVAIVGNVLTYADTGLSNGVTYWYQVTAVNAVGEGVRSPERSAMPILPGDTVLPMIAFELPGNNSPNPVPKVPGNWTAAGNASDNVAVAEVLLSTDGVNWVPANGTTSWSGVVYLHAGNNTVFARATDPSGNSNTAEAVVYIPAPVEVAPGPPGFGPPVWVWPLAAVGIAAVAAAGYILLRNRRKRDGGTPP